MNQMENKTKTNVIFLHFFLFLFCLCTFFVCHITTHPLTHSVASNYQTNVEGRSSVLPPRIIITPQTPHHPPPPTPAVRAASPTSPSGTGLSPLLPPSPPPSLHPVLLAAISTSFPPPPSSVPSLLSDTLRVAGELPSVFHLPLSHLSHSLPADPPTQRVLRVHEGGLAHTVQSCQRTPHRTASGVLYRCGTAGGVSDCPGRGSLLLVSKDGGQM